MITGRSSIVISWLLSRSSIVSYSAKISNNRPAEDPNFMSTIIAGDASCIHGYHPGTQRASFALEEPSATKTKEGTSSSKAQPRACWYFSLAFSGLCTINSSSRVTPLMPSTTVTFWAVWGRTFGSNDPNCSEMVTLLSNVTAPVYNALETSEFLASNNTVLNPCLHPTRWLFLPGFSHFSKMMFGLWTIVWDPW